MKFPLQVHRDRRFDVFSFGTNSVDYLITVPRFPEYASKLELSSYIRAAGGEAASTAVGLQRLGMRAAYAGSFGDDEEGSFGIVSLEREGVDVTYSKRIEGASTQIAFIIIDEVTGERSVIWKRDERLAFTAQDAPTDAVADCGILHMTPHDTAACIAMARAARENGTIVSLDIDNAVEGLAELLPLVDILMCSSDCPAQLTGFVERKDALAALNRKFGSPVCGMTLGSNGSLLLCNGTFFETPGFDVPEGCRDTTGAGDAFRAGFSYGLLKEEPIEHAARTANAVAALKCRELGARTALPDENELRAFLRNS